MNTANRIEALWAIYQQLDELLTPDELSLYDPLTGLGDLIEDLQLEIDA